jgi:hypothetical protein
MYSGSYNPAACPRRLEASCYSETSVIASRHGVISWRTWMFRKLILWTLHIVRSSYCTEPSHFICRIVVLTNCSKIDRIKLQIHWTDMYTRRGVCQTVRSSMNVSVGPIQYVFSLIFWEFVMSVSRFVQGGSNMTGTNCDLFTQK